MTAILQYFSALATDACSVKGVTWSEEPKEKHPGVGSGSARSFGLQANVLYSLWCC